MSAAADRLREFHDAFDVEPNVDQRIHLHAEEAQELSQALAALAAFERGTSIVPTRRALLPAIARELADVMVVAYGTADVLGIDLDAAFDAVMDANMAKLPVCESCHGGELAPEGYLASDGVVRTRTPTCPTCNGTGKGKPIKRDDGKVLKSPGWTPPDMSGAIK